jgi:hypothetical protein
VGLVFQYLAIQHLVSPVWDQWVLKYFRVFLEFFKLHLALTNFFREKLFLHEDTIASDKHFAFSFIIKTISFGFPRIPPQKNIYLTLE